MKYQIGEFSYISRFSVKTLRYYQEEKLLEPSSIDPQSGYRFYDEESVEQARVIRELKSLNFSIKEIKEIVLSCSSDSEIVAFIEKKDLELGLKIKKYSDIQKKLKEIKLHNIGKALYAQESILKEQRFVQLIASIRFKGKYKDFGAVLSKLYGVVGRYAKGGPFTLYWNLEYKEIADIEIAIPVKKILKNQNINIKVGEGAFLDGDFAIREFTFGESFSYLHKGRYETLGDSYSVLFSYLKNASLEVQLPILETYIKGPGMIFSGNPDSYLTKINFCYG